MTPVRLSAVGYLNARPLVYGLDRSSRFEIRFDVPSICADLLHAGRIDVGLIPSIEYLRGTGGAGDYRIVPDLAIASNGEVASVILYTTRPMSDVRSIAMDTSSRTSVALVSVLCARLFDIRPTIESRAPDLTAMLASCDAALIIGDNALLADVPVGLGPGARFQTLERIDLGEAWSRLTGLPFVWAFWAGRAGALTAGDVGALQEARDAGVARSDEIAREYFPDSPAWQAIGARYLRDNVKHSLGPQERAGLELFYQWAADAGSVEAAGPLRFF